MHKENVLKEEVEAAIRNFNKREAPREDTNLLQHKLYKPESNVQRKCYT